MRIVLDANVVVAAFASRGLCESLLELCLHNHQIVLCAGLLEEIRRALLHKIKLPPRAVDEIANLLREHATLVSPAVLPSDSCRDPRDVKVLGLAVAANADCIVSGDNDLLALQSFRSIPILSPTSFSAILRGKGADSR